MRAKFSTAIIALMLWAFVCCGPAASSTYYVDLLGSNNSNIHISSTSFEVNLCDHGYCLQADEFTVTFPIESTLVLGSLSIGYGLFPFNNGFDLVPGYYLVSTDPSQDTVADFNDGFSSFGPFPGCDGGDDDLNCPEELGPLPPSTTVSLGSVAGGYVQLIWTDGLVGYYPPTPPPTPLPATFPLFATGLGVMCLFGRRRKRKNAAI